MSLGDLKVTLYRLSYRGRAAHRSHVAIHFCVAHSMDDNRVMATATWHNATLAESTKTQTVEGNQYFPADAIHQEFFVASDHTTVCPWKGTAHYYHVVVDGERNENAAWFYPEPKTAAANIKGHVAFWKGVKVAH